MTDADKRRGPEATRVNFCNGGGTPDFQGSI